MLGDKRFELLKAIAIEFTAQPFLPIKEPSFTINLVWIRTKYNLFPSFVLSIKLKTCNYR